MCLKFEEKETKNRWGDVCQGDLRELRDFQEKSKELEAKIDVLLRKISTHKKSKVKIEPSSAKTK